MLIDEKKLELFRKNFREVVIIALAVVVYAQQKIITAKDIKMDQMRQEQISDLKAQAKEDKDKSVYWRDAFITTAKYNVYLISKDSIK